MITEYQTLTFQTPQNHKNPTEGNHIDELCKQAKKDIRFASNKLKKMKTDLFNLSTNQSNTCKPEDIEIIELIATLYNAELIEELKFLVRQSSSILKDLKKHQRNRLEKIEEISNEIKKQIETTYQDDCNSDSEIIRLGASIRRTNDEHKLCWLKNNLRHMRKDILDAEFQSVAQ